jgi:DnaJ-class molecular chaperone
MSATLFDEAVRDAGAERATEDQRARRGLTLEQLLSGAWEGLAVHTSVVCPACRESEMSPRYASGPAAAPVGGRCHGCGATLA